MSNGQHSSDVDTQSSHSTHVTSGLSTNHESDEAISNSPSELEKSYENTQNQSQDSVYTRRMNTSSDTSSCDHSCDHSHDHYHEAHRCGEADTDSCCSFGENGTKNHECEI